MLDASLFRSYEARKQAHYTMNPVSNQKKLESPIATRAIKKPVFMAITLKQNPIALSFFHANLFCPRYSETRKYTEIHFATSQISEQRNAIFICFQSRPIFAIPAKYPNTIFSSIPTRH